MACLDAAGSAWEHEGGHGAGLGLPPEGYSARVSVRVANFPT
ncbi:hypothetical protein [Arthrobacter methylotrophus]